MSGGRAPVGSRAIAVSERVQVGDLGIEITRLASTSGYGSSAPKIPGQEIGRGLSFYKGERWLGYAAANPHDITGMTVQEALEVPPLKRAYERIQKDLAKYE